MMDEDIVVQMFVSISELKTNVETDFRQVVIKSKNRQYISHIGYYNRYSNLPFFSYLFYLNSFTMWANPPEDMKMQYIPWKSYTL